MCKITFKITILITSAILLATILSGCGGSDSKSSGSANEGDGSTTLTMLISETADTPGFRAVVDAIEQELNIKTEIERRPGGPEGENIVKTRLATGGMADLVLFNSGSLLMALNPEEHFVDLTNEPYMDKVMDTYKEVVSDNGKVFGIPAKSSQVGGWLYNKRVYEELGLSVPKTWDELIKIGRAHV